MSSNWGIGFGISYRAKITRSVQSFVRFGRSLHIPLVTNSQSIPITSYSTLLYTMSRGVYLYPMPLSAVSENRNVNALDLSSVNFYYFQLVWPLFQPVL